MLTIAISTLRKRKLEVICTFDRDDYVVLICKGDKGNFEVRIKKGN